MGGGRDPVAVRADGSRVPVEIGLNPLLRRRGVRRAAARYDRDEALECAERIRAAVAAAKLELLDEPITISLGVAVQPADGDVLRELIAAADEAMYRAKREGRNRVESVIGPDA